MSTAQSSSLTPSPLAIAGFSVAYGAVKAVDGIDLVCPAGQITCVMGRNGVGKTSLLRGLMGQVPSTGTVQLGDTALTGLPSYARARLGLGLVPQGREIFPKLTVAENLSVGLAARSDGARRIPDDVFDLFAILRPFAKRLGGDLSGGQQQQLAIARALAGAPQALLLDEPTEGIQPNIIQEIGRVLQRLATSGMTIVLVEQYLDFVREIGHRFAIMDRGRIVAEGATAALTPALVAQHLSV